MSPWCPFLSTSLVIYHSNKGVTISRATYLTLLASFDEVVIDDLFELQNSGKIDMSNS